MFSRCSYLKNLKKEIKARRLKTIYLTTRVVSILTSLLTSDKIEDKNIKSAIVYPPMVLIETFNDLLN